MSPIKRQRLFLVVLLLSGLSLAAYFLFKAFNENMMFFFAPSDVKAGKAPTNQPFRLGGLVEQNTLKRLPDSLEVQFVVSDGQQAITVSYTGILPDLFREGQGIIAKGQLNADGFFIASEVLAKHDETYMPPEVADALQRTQTSSSVVKP